MSASAVWQRLAGPACARRGARAVLRDINGDLMTLGKVLAAICKASQTPPIATLRRRYTAQWNARIRVRRFLHGVAVGKTPAPPASSASVRNLIRRLEAQLCSCEHSKGHRCVEQRAMRAAAALLRGEP